MASNATEISVVVSPADEVHCRQTEASILPFADGRLFLAYTDFYGGEWRDGGPARIVGRWSRNEGETWSEPFLVQENIRAVHGAACSGFARPAVDLDESQHPLQPDLCHQP